MLCNSTGTACTGVTRGRPAGSWESMPFHVRTPLPQCDLNPQLAVPSCAASSEYDSVLPPYMYCLHISRLVGRSDASHSPVFVVLVGRCHEGRGSNAAGFHRRPRCIVHAGGHRVGGRHSVTHPQAGRETSLDAAIAPASTSRADGKHSHQQPRASGTSSLRGCCSGQHTVLCTCAGAKFSASGGGGTGVR